MPLLEIFFWSFVVYYLYRFVFNFVLPVAKATRHVRQQFRNMQDPNMGNPMGDHADPSRRAYTTTSKAPDPARPGPTQRSGQNSSGKAPAGDYIDFEEVK